MINIQLSPEIIFYVDTRDIDIIKISKEYFVNIITFLENNLEVFFLIFSF